MLIWGRGGGCGAWYCCGCGGCCCCCKLFVSIWLSCSWTGGWNCILAGCGACGGGGSGCIGGSDNDPCIRFGTRLLLVSAGVVVVVVNLPNSNSFDGTVGNCCLLAVVSIGVSSTGSVVFGSPDSSIGLASSIFSTVSDTIVAAAAATLFSLLNFSASFCSCFSFFCVSFSSSFRLRFASFGDADCSCTSRS